MTIDMNKLVECAPLFSTDDGYQVARRKLQDIITPQQHETIQFNSPIGYNPWGSGNLPYISPINPYGSGPTRSSGSTSPF